jgi:hypothetical protein
VHPGYPSGQSFFVDSPIVPYCPEQGDGNRWKIGLIILCQEADRFSDGTEQNQEQRNPCFDNCPLHGRVRFLIMTIVMVTADIDVIRC